MTSSRKFYQQWRSCAMASMQLKESATSSFSEKILHMIWMHQRFRNEKCMTTDGHPLAILHPGFWNYGPGPDFRSAVISVNGKKMNKADIEIDVKASYWRSHRHDLNPLEEAEAYSRLANEFALTQEMVAKKVGKSRTSVANILRLLKLSRNIKEDLISEKISMGHARALLGLENSKQMEILRKDILKQDLTVRQTEDRVNKVKTGSVSKSVSLTAKKNIFIKDLEKELARRLGTKVDISPKTKGGKLIVSYYSDDDLERIQGLMGIKRK